MRNAPDEPPEHPPFPMLVLIAGLWWALLGALFALVSCVGGLLSVAVQVQQPGPVRPNPAAACTMWLGIIIGAGFLVAGFRIARGSAAGVLLTSVLSSLVGLLYLALGALLLWVASNQRPQAPAGFADALLFSGIVGVLVGCALLLPAGLALAARYQYLAWRASARPRRRRGRGRGEGRDRDRPQRGDESQRRPWERRRRNDEDEEG